MKIKKAVALAACLGIFSAAAPRDSNAIAAAIMWDKTVAVIGGAITATGAAVAGGGVAAGFLIEGGALGWGFLSFLAAPYIIAAGIVVLPASGGDRPLRFTRIPLDENTLAALELSHAEGNCYNHHVDVINGVSEEVWAELQLEESSSPEERKSAFTAASASASELWKARLKNYEVPGSIPSAYQCDSIQTAYPGLRAVSARYFEAASRG